MSYVWLHAVLSYNFPLIRTNKTNQVERNFWYIEWNKLNTLEHHNSNIAMSHICLIVSLCKLINLKSCNFFFYMYTTHRLNVETDSSGKQTSSSLFFLCFFVCLFRFSTLPVLACLLDIWEFQLKNEKHDWNKSISFSIYTELEGVNINLTHLKNGQMYLHLCLLSLWLNRKDSYDNIEVVEVTV